METNNRQRAAGPAWSMRGAALALLLGTAGAGAANAGEIYGNVGFPGVMLGYAQPISDRVTLRGDFSTIGNYSKSFEEEGIDYDGELKLNRLGVFADWFVAGGGFRLTGGLTFNDARLDLTAEGSGRGIEINDTTVTLGANDRFDVEVEYPKVMPYLGIGYGHQRAEPGLGFVFDVGVAIGRAKVRGRVTGDAFTAAGVTQEDVDAELEELRDGVGKLRVLPQISVGLNYRF